MCVLKFWKSMPYKSFHVHMFVHWVKWVFFFKLSSNLISDLTCKRISLSLLTMKPALLCDILSSIWFCEIIFVTVTSSVIIIKTRKRTIIPESSKCHFLINLNNTAPSISTFANPNNPVVILTSSSDSADRGRSIIRVTLSLDEGYF